LKAVEILFLNTSWYDISPLCFVPSKQKELKAYMASHSKTSSILGLSLPTGRIDTSVGLKYEHCRTRAGYVSHVIRLLHPTSLFHLCLCHVLHSISPVNMLSCPAPPRGLLACANQNSPNTNGSQFFITLDKTDWLEKKNTIFGKVVGDTIYNLLRIGDCEVMTYVCMCNC
jgi:hypothetical protein